MRQPYRVQAEMHHNKLVLPRTKARLRGLYRRVILPAKVIGALTVLGVIANGCVWDQISNTLEKEDAIAKLHYRDWEEAAKARGAKLDTRQATIEQQERELNNKIKTFEMVVLLVKPNSLPNTEITNELFKGLDLKQPHPEQPRFTAGNPTP